jgi:hypothetical protein
MNKLKQRLRMLTHKKKKNPRRKASRQKSQFGRDKNNKIVFAPPSSIPKKSAASVGVQYIKQEP